MSGKISKKNKRLTVEKKKNVPKKTMLKKEIVPKTKTAEIQKMKVALPKSLREKIKAEKNPEKIIADAVSEYYAETRRRSDVSIQKEIDNNIIEVQRRHISDLKEQLNASNKNYEDLMKTYQAYMLQVQPMIEAAQKKEIEAKTRPKTEKKNEPDSEAVEKVEKTEAEQPNQTAPVTKKWYEFWK